MRTETCHRCFGPTSPAALMGCLCVMGCVDTAPEALAPPPLCISASPAADPAASVVLVEGTFGLAGKTVCSGYAVTPSIVLTDSVCLVMPADLMQSDLDRRVETPSFQGNSPIYSADVIYASICETDAGWEPRELGLFETWLDEPIEPNQVSVSVLFDEQAVAVTSARRMFLPHAHSRCSDSIAALVLAEPLPVPYRPVRLVESTAPGDAVIMSSLGPTSVTTLDRSANVEVVTHEVAENGAPPRSLLLSKQSCYYEPGGGVLAEPSHALIGVMAYGTGECGDPLGKTVVARLAPFGKMLLEAAENAEDTLHVEPSPTIRTPAPVRACDGE
jgi:hypothetical protein